MRLLIGYDGAAAATTALHDLMNAALQAGRCLSAGRRGAGVDDTTWSRGESHPATRPHGDEALQVGSRHGCVE